MRDFALKELGSRLGVDMAGRLENELYAYAVETVGIPFADWDFDCVRQSYKHKLRALLTALREGPDTIKSIETTGAKLRDLLHMAPSELNPALWREWVDASKHLPPEESEQDQRYGEVACTSCLRRGQPAHRTVYSQLQTRSADEGLTTYFLCYNCGKRWRG